jgi:hypothetical protein
MQIDVRKLEEAGYHSAMFGLALNKNQDPTKMHQIAEILSDKDKGHNKFLESIYVWLGVKAPRYWWSEADTYRLSSKQSQSTIHTLMKAPLVYNDFEDNDIEPDYLEMLNRKIDDNDFLGLKKRLPEGFMQGREWCLSKKTLRNIIVQRDSHKLPHWSSFIEQVISQVNYPEFLKKRL